MGLPIRWVCSLEGGIPSDTPARSIQRQCCFDVGDDQIRPEAALRLLADLVDEVCAGLQLQFGMDLWIDVVDLLEHKIRNVLQLFLILRCDVGFVVDGADDVHHCWRLQ